MSAQGRYCIPFFKNSVLISRHTHFPNRVTPLVAGAACCAVDAQVAVAAVQVEVVGAVAEGAADEAGDVGPVGVVVGALNLVSGGVSRFPIDGNGGQVFRSAEIQSNPAWINCRGRFPTSAAVFVDGVRGGLCVGATGCRYWSQRSCTCAAGYTASNTTGRNAG